MITLMLPKRGDYRGPKCNHECPPEMQDEGDVTTTRKSGCVHGARGWSNAATGHGCQPPWGPGGRQEPLQGAWPRRHLGPHSKTDVGLLASEMGTEFFLWF